MNQKKSHCHPERNYFLLPSNDMIINNTKSFLTIKVIWKDDPMFEIEVSACNKRYFGLTEVYDTTESLSSFAKQLKGFPDGRNSLFYEAGEKDSYSYFSMEFSLISPSGQVGVLIHLEENVSTEYRDGEKDKLKLEVIVEPSAIDNFQKELLRLALKEEGEATLNGI